MTSWQQELGDLGEKFRTNSNDDFNNFQSPEDTKLDILRMCSMQKNKLKNNCAAKRLDTFAILMASFSMKGSAREQTLALLFLILLMFGFNIFACSLYSSVHELENYNIYSDALIFITEWNQFPSLDLAKISNS